MAERVPARLTSREGRRFAFPVGAAFAVLSGLTAWRGHTPAAITLGALAGFFIVAGLAVPDRLGGVYRGWMALAHAISRVTTPIFMGIVFFLILTPMGLLRRAFGRDSLVHVERGGSYLVDRAEGVAGRSDLRRQF